LKALSSQQALSVSEVIAGMTALQGSPVVLTSEEVAELDREWAAIKAGEHTVSP
jgi:hypothetical protein